MLSGGPDIRVLRHHLLTRRAHGVVGCVCGRLKLWSWTSGYFLVRAVVRRVSTIFLWFDWFDFRFGLIWPLGRWQRADGRGATHDGRRTSAMRAVHYTPTLNLQEPPQRPNPNQCQTGGGSKLLKIAKLSVQASNHSESPIRITL